MASRAECLPRGRAVFSQGANLRQEVDLKWAMANMHGLEQAPQIATAQQSPWQRVLKGLRELGAKMAALAKIEVFRA